VASLTAHVQKVEAGLFAGVLGAARAAAQLVPLAVLLVVLSPQLAVAALGVFVPFAVGLAAVRRRWKRANARAAHQEEEMLAAADESVRHADLWVTYGAEAKARASVAALGEAMERRRARLEASAAALSGANEVLGALALVCAMAAARAGWLGEGQGGGASLLAFAVAFFLAYRPIRDLGDARNAYARAESAYDRLRGADESAHAAASAGASASASASASAGARARAWPLAGLEVAGVTVAKGAAAPISLTVPAGEIVALVGPTGAGKTTLLRALLGLEPVEAGSIRFGGEPLERAAAGPSARPFAWVPQEAPLLADTVSANVALADGAADPRDALGAVGAAHLLDAAGDARLVAERALSGGERQWVALARAIATRQPVLLLDEPTSGLDRESQARVLEAIARLRGERSVLMVTHREEPLAIADRVVRLDSALALAGESLEASAFRLEATGKATRERVS
jgi:ABC-type multidrug transport system fused ATPase/permease subunit